MAFVLDCSITMARKPALVVEGLLEHLWLRPAVTGV